MIPADQRDLAPLLERLAFDAWQAGEVADQEGWRVRFNHGVTRRAGSVWPNLVVGDTCLEDRIARAEAFYRERGVEPLFQLSPAARPGSLDAALEERGYAVEAPVSVQVASTQAVSAATELHAEGAELSEGLTEAWFSVPSRGGRFSGSDNHAYRSLLERARERPCFALARVGGTPAAVAMGVAQSGWVGIFAVLTLAEYRGRGLGARVLGAIAGWAAGRGDPGMYLQVERGNPAAQRLFRRVGFVPCYGYHYRRSSA